MRPSIARANEQLDPRKQLANTPPPQSTTPGLHPISIHQMTPSERTSDCSLLLIYRSRKDERLSWPSWLTCSGRFTRQRKFAGQRPTSYHCAKPPTCIRSCIRDRCMDPYKTFRLSNGAS